MTNIVARIGIAILCAPDTQLASVAPFLDLARLSKQVGGVLMGRGNEPAIDIDLLYDAGSAAPPFERALPVGLDHLPSGYSAIILPASDDLIDPVNGPDARCIAWLRSAHAQGTWIVGIGSGVLGLAAAGLLDGGPASVPPRHSMLVRHLYPGVTMGHASGIAEHGHVLTASETASAFALAVTLARRIHSHGLAERYRRTCGIAETLVPDDIFLPMRHNRDILVAEARAWIIAHMQEDIDTARIAAHFHVSARTLSRRFQMSTGTTPARFLRLARMDAAISMLQRTRFSIEQIAHLVGYGDVGFFREAFRARVGCSPQQFRMSQFQVT
jgi:transcriptional regulator GlxA family with amidase domain